MFSTFKMLTCRNKAYKSEISSVFLDIQLLLFSGEKMQMEVLWRKFSCMIYYGEFLSPVMYMCYMDSTINKPAEFCAWN